MRLRASCFATLAVLSLLLFSASPARQKSSVIVTAADPDSAAPGTVNLDVLINGKGFKKGAVARFFVSGTTNPGGIIVNSTTFLDAHHLKANINVANNAPRTKFDISVYLINGSSGKGTQLFAVAVPNAAIAFTAPQHETLTTMNTDGTDPFDLLQAPKGVSIYRPNWSPDGARLVFESDFEGDAIYVINRDGTGMQKVIDLNKGGGLARPVWSPRPAPDGEWKIAFSDQVAGQLQNNLFLVNLDGTGLINLTNEPESSQYWPTWAPGALRLAASVFSCPTNSNCAPHLYVYNLGLVGGVVGITGTTDLTAVGGALEGLAVQEPDWARMHDQIAFVGRQVVNSANSAIWIVSLANPLNPIELTATENTGAASPSWSPDDSKIVFSEEGKNKHKATISIIRADGFEFPNLADGENPAWRRCCPTCATPCAP